MSALALVSRWVAARDLPRASALDLVPSSKLRNTGGPQYFVRPADDELRSKGTVYDIRELDGLLLVGHLYFHPGTRVPPIPPVAELEAFMASHPELPVVVDSDRAQPCEWPHLVLAQLVSNGAGECGLDRDGIPLVNLCTIAADSASRAFDPATHVKGGEQKEGVDIFDWETVNFDQAYRRPVLFETFRAIYRELRRAAVE